MPISLKPKHVQRYKDIAALALKYRHVDADPATASPPIAPGVTPSGVDSKAAELAAILPLRPRAGRSAKVTSLSPLTKIDIDGVGLAEELFRAYLKPPGAARPRAA